MFDNSPRPVIQRAKRMPSSRNMQIYEEVRLLGQRQEDVALKHGVNQKRISQVCQQVDRWLDWVQASPDRERIEAEQRRQILLDVRKRNEQLMLVALRHATGGGQRLVSERRLTKGSETTIDRTERELPTDSAWLRIAYKASNNIARISQKLGIDLQSGTLGPEVDALLAAMLLKGDETELAHRDSAKSSRSSKTSMDRSPVEVIVSDNSFDASHCGNEACVESGEAGLADFDRPEQSKFLAPEVWYESACATDPSPAQIPKNPQFAESKLLREVRERRARFLQSCSEPEDDKKRLVKNAPW
jgi:hypothetical protein